MYNELHTCIVGYRAGEILWPYYQKHGNYLI